jgi:hypothetical protein
MVWGGLRPLALQPWRRLDSVDDDERLSPPDGYLMYLFLAPALAPPTESVRSSSVVTGFLLVMAESSKLPWPSRSQK